MISARKPSHVGGAIYRGIVMLATVGALSEDDAIGPGRMLVSTALGVGIVAPKVAVAH